MYVHRHVNTSFLWHDFVIVTRESLCALSNGVSHVNYILLKFSILDTQLNCSIVKKEDKTQIANCKNLLFKYMNYLLLIHLNSSIFIGLLWKVYSILSLILI